MPSSITSRWATTAVAAVFVALAAFLAVTALGIGGHHARPAASAPYTLTPFATYEARAPHVLSSTVINSAQGAVEGAAATPPSVLPRCRHPPSTDPQRNTAPMPSANSA